MSEKLQEIRLNGYRANRKAEEEERKVQYYQGLHKRMNEIIHDLEEKSAMFESEMHKKEEQFRKRDNERIKELFNANKFNDIAESLTKSRPDQIKSQIDRTANLTNTSTTRLG